MTDEQVMQKQQMMPGEMVSAEQKIPVGWRKVRMDDGILEAWPIAPASHDPEQRRKILSQVDKAYALTLPTEDYPDRKAVQMWVNKEWRDLFPNQRSWDNDCPIDLAPDGRVLPGDGPRFKFVVEGGPNVGTPSDKEKEAEKFRQE